MAKFDAEGARAAGYTDAEIANYLANQSGFNAIAAREAGYTDAEIIAYLSGARPPREGMDKATQLAGVTTGALLPYATAAGLGAAAGAPLAGIGAIPGAAAGVLSLGIGDLGTSVYNLAAPVFGGERVPLPSETIRQAYQNVGIGRTPETPGERVYSDILEAGASGFGQAKAFQNLADVAVSPQSQNFMRFMGQRPGSQTAASIGAGGAPSIASNYFDVNNPAALFGLSLAGGAMGAGLTTPKNKPISAEKLKADADALYKQMEAEGVNVSPQAMNDLAAEARTALRTFKYDPHTDKLVNEVLDLFDKKAGQPISFDMLDKFRRSVRDYPYSEAGGARGTDEQRAMVAALEDTIDTFMDRLTPQQTTAGDADVANTYLTQARDIRAKGYRTETLEDAFTRATKKSKRVDSTKSFSEALRDEFYKINENPRKLSKFDEPTQKLIEKVAEGTRTQNALAGVGKLAPTFQMAPYSARGVPGAGLLAGSGTAFYSGEPSLAALGLLLAGSGTTAKGLANKMSRGQAQEALASASGVKPKGFNYFALSPTVQQAYQTVQTATQFPRISPETGEELIDIGYNEDGSAYPIYGQVSKNNMAPSPAPAR